MGKLKGLIDADTGQEFDDARELGTLLREDDLTDSPLIGPAPWFHSLVPSISAGNSQQFQRTSDGVRIDLFKLAENLLYADFDPDASAFFAPAMLQAAPSLFDVEVTMKALTIPSSNYYYGMFGIRFGIRDWFALHCKMNPVTGQFTSWVAGWQFYETFNVSNTGSFAAETERIRVRIRSDIAMVDDSGNGNRLLPYAARRWSFYYHDGSEWVYIHSFYEQPIFPPALPPLELVPIYSAANPSGIPSSFFHGELYLANISAHSDDLSNVPAIFFCPSTDLVGGPSEPFNFAMEFSNFLNVRTLEGVPSTIIPPA